jgi:hypothetical protein
MTTQSKRLTSALTATVCGTLLGLYITPAAPAATTVKPSLTVTEHSGRPLIDVDGHAAAGTTLTIVLRASMDHDLPTVVLARTTTSADATGHFAAELPIAPAYFSGTIFTVSVTPAGGTATQTATIRLEQAELDQPVGSDTPSQTGH